MFRNFALPTLCICEYILYHLYKKFAVSACSVHQFVIPMQAVGQSQLEYFRTGQHWIKKKNATTFF
jgi:hypothetical protein